MSTISRISIAALALICLNATLAVAQLPSAERENLIAFFEATHGVGWVDNSNWCKSDCPTVQPVTFNDPGTECTWFGVQCDSGQSHVIGIALLRNGLTGSLPIFDSLPAMTYLDVTQNDLSGTIPSLEQLPALESLVLTSNHFSGPLPALEGLGNLDYVDVNNNFFEGPLPSLNLPKVTLFNIANNRIGGEIPPVDNLISALELALGDNQLAGPMPDFSSLTALQLVTLGGNHLSGNLTPAPPNLSDRSSTLCPNALSIAPTANDAAWNEAAESSPWWHSTGGCDELFFGAFDD